MKNDIRKMVTAAMLTSIGVFMPTLTHMLGFDGKAFLPMHFTVLMCGLICGWKYGGMSGLLVPLLCCLITGMPPVPIAFCMAFELATYGIITGALKDKFNMRITLIIAMLGGRVTYSIFAAIFLNAFSSMDVFKVHLTSLFITSLPGIIIQIILVPVVIKELYRDKLITAIPGPTKYNQTPSLYS